jgi:predicted acetyltransferase
MMARAVTKTELLALRLPRLDEEAEFLRAHRATSPEVPHFLHSYEEGMSFGRYQPHHVPSTFRFAFLERRIVGRVSIRHLLNAFLEQVGGHIGYVVVPEFRRRGYATAMLSLSVHIARETLGIQRILVTCDDDNIGSIKTIERNGGILENVISGPDLGKPKRRYWIERP